MEMHFDTFIELAINYSPKIVLALFTLIVGFWLANKLANLSGSGMRKRQYDPSLIQFLKSLISVSIKVMVVIAAADVIGIRTTSFVAVIGAASLAIGLALQGSLANFAGGVLILIFKPFKVGDLIESQGQLGTVKEIQIFNTILITFDNKTVILPNGSVTNNHIVNYSKEGKIRVELVAGISYSSNIKQAKEVIERVLQSHSNVLQDPEPFVGVLELADSSVNLAVRPWCKPEDYWQVYFDIYEQTKIALDEAGIEIPFPQRVIHQANS